jgi:uncharacterized membrane protein YciS (DUF1049 family)
MFNLFFSEETLDKICEYATYLVATCAVVIATLLVVLIASKLYEGAIVLAVVVFIAGPALGFLIKNIMNFLIERFG